MEVEAVVPEARLIDGEWVTIEDLIKKHAALINLIIKKYKRERLSGIMDWDDLRSIAYEGLIMAFQRFNPDKGVKFTTVLDLWVKHRMQKELVSSELLYVPHGTHSIAQQIKVNGDTHLKADAIMTKYGCKFPTALALEQYFQYSFWSIHYPVGGSDGDRLAEELLGFEQDQSSVTVREFLHTLDEEQVWILNMRAKELTLNEIGKLKGVSRQAIHLRINRIQRMWTEFNAEVG